MEELRQFPKTKYLDLINYASDLNVIYATYKIGSSLILSLESLPDEFYFLNLVNSIEKLRLEYKDKLDMNDYYNFRSFSDLEKFLIYSANFPTEKVERSINLGVLSTDGLLERGLKNIIVGCWLAVDEHKKMKYLTNVNVGVGGFNDFKKGISGFGF